MLKKVMKEDCEHLSIHTIELSQALLNRYSCRAYLDKPVPEEMLKAVFTLAQRAPTSSNTQSARVYVLQGDVKDTFVASLSLTSQQRPGWHSRDLPEHSDAGQLAALKRRRLEVAKGLEAAVTPTGIDKDALPALRAERFKANYNFWGGASRSYCYYGRSNKS